MRGRPRKQRRKEPQRTGEPGRAGEDGSCDEDGLPSSLLVDILRYLPFKPKDVATLRAASGDLNSAVGEVLEWDGAFMGRDCCIANVPTVFGPRDAPCIDHPLKVTLRCKAQLLQLAAYEASILCRLSLIPQRLHIHLTIKNGILALVKGLSVMRSLRTLDLSVSKVTDAGIAGLEAIPTLENLNLRDTAVTDVSKLSSCKALKVLDLRYSKVTETGIAWLQGIPTLEIQRV